MGDDRHTLTGVDLGDLILVFGVRDTLEWHCSFSLFDSERYVIPRPVFTPNIPMFLSFIERGRSKV